MSFSVSEFGQGEGRWLTQQDLLQPYQVMTIQDMKVEQVGKEKERKCCIYFAGAPKPYACNPTGINRLVEVFGDNSAGWLGKQVVVYRAMTQYQGRAVLCIRLCAVHQFPFKASPADPPETCYDNHGNAVPVGPLQPAPQPPTQPGYARPAPQPPTQPGYAQPAPQPPTQPVAEQAP